MTDLSAEHPMKHHSPIDLTESGISTETRDSHHEKAASPRAVTESGMETERTESCQEKALSAIAVTGCPSYDEGILTSGPVPVNSSSWAEPSRRMLKMKSDIKSTLLSVTESNQVEKSGKTPEP